MLQHLLRRLVFDVPILNEFAKMPLKVRAALGRSPSSSTSSAADHAQHSWPARETEKAN